MSTLKRVSIDPVTRLEGHARIDLFLDDDGRLRDCALVIPELRGFETFLVGRPVEEAARITSRICGVCPEAHHTAAAKAADVIYGVAPPPAGELVRRLQYNAFAAGDHATHFFALGGPDFIVGPAAPPSRRNIIGVVQKVGAELGGQVIAMRRVAHEVAELLGGRRIHPVGMIPGGVSRPVTAEQQTRLRQIGDEMVAFAETAQRVFAKVVLGNKGFRRILEESAFQFRCRSMGLVNEHGEPDYYDGRLRVVDADGAVTHDFAAAEYGDHIVERVASHSYLKYPYLKDFGWRGLGGGPDTGIYRVGPLAMLNVADRMQTPLAQAEYEKFFAALGGRPVHATLAFHWARLVAMLQNAELVRRHAADPLLTDGTVRIVADGPVVRQGVGVVEAPRGVLVHHYWVDADGLIERANLVVGTGHNHAAIAASVHQAAGSLLAATPTVSEPLLNVVEMALRAYDPCFACATHALPGRMPLKLRIFDGRARLVRTVARGRTGTVVTEVTE